jgi:hypothetical protein
LFLAGVCGAIGMVMPLLSWLTGLHALTLVAVVALVPGTVLLVASYVQLVREWLGRRRTPRIDVYIFALPQSDPEEETIDAEEPAR